MSATDTTLTGTPGTLAAPRRRRMPVLVAGSFVLVGVALVCAAVGWAFTPYPPNAQDLQAGLSAPGGAHLLGTDDVGRDILSRLIAGARTAVVGPLLIAVGTTLIANVLGVVAGYRGGLVDTFIMRWVDLMFSLPALLVVIVVAGILGGGYLLCVAILVILFSPWDTRVIRGATLEQRALPYVEAARVLGVPSWRIMAHHIWPNVLPVTVANMFLNFATGIVALSSLAFLGVGIGPGTPDWGRMLSESRTMLFGNPAAALAPAAMIVLTAVGMNVIGDWAYERLSDRGRSR